MKRLPIGACRRQLAVLWFSAALLLLVILVVQSLGGKYGSRTGEAWGWLLPAIMPTLSLMLGVLVLSATTQDATKQSVEPFLFHLAFGVSVAYFVMLALVPLVQPLTSSPPLELMKLSGLWLGPLQGIVTGVLGVFFVRSERGPKDDAGAMDTE